MTMRKRILKRDKVVLIGAGAQGCVTMEIMQNSGLRVFGFLDDDDAMQKIAINGGKVIGRVNDAIRMSKDNCKFILCLGNNYLREKIQKKLGLAAKSYTNCIHKSSVILSSAKIGYGNMIFANTFVGSNTSIGNHVIINNGSIIEHDCVIGDFATVSSGCCIGGRIVIKKRAFVSMGAILNPRVTIGENSIVGSGSVVVKDIPANVLAYGVPARVVKKISGNTIWDRLL